MHTVYPTGNPVLFCRIRGALTWTEDSKVLETAQLSSNVMDYEFRTLYTAPHAVVLPERAVINDQVTLQAQNLRSTLSMAYQFASESPKAQEIINDVLAKLEDFVAMVKATQTPAPLVDTAALRETLTEELYQHRLHNAVYADGGDNYMLVDMLTPDGEAISEGRQEIDRIVDVVIEKVAPYSLPADYRRLRERERFTQWAGNPPVELTNAASLAGVKTDALSFWCWSAWCKALGLDASSETQVSPTAATAASRDNNNAEMDLGTLTAPVLHDFIARHGYEEVARMLREDGWVSVDEALPPALPERQFSEQVLVVNMNSGMPHVMLSELNCYPSENVWRGCSPTHWKKCPKLPAKP